MTQFNANPLSLLKRTAALFLVSAVILSGVSCEALHGSGDADAARSNVLSGDETAERSLKEFLSRFVSWYPVSSGGEWKYDSSSPKTDCNILACIASPASCADWTLYSSVPEEDCFVEKSDDPKGWAEETYAYYVYDAQTVEFIAREIFNVSERDIDVLARSGEIDNRFYKEGGMYYTLFEGTFDHFTDIDLISVEKDGNRYNAVFSVSNIGKKGDEDDLVMITGKCRAELALKNIGGREFWSLYRFENIHS